MIEPRSSQPVPTVRRFTHDAMACTFGLDIVVASDAYARQAAKAAFDELDRLEDTLSRFIPHSDIARINALAPGQSVQVSDETIECLQLATQLYADTGGAFDIAFGSVDRTSPTPPLVCDPLNHAVGVQVAGLVLDLGGLGKGYALDRMVAILHEWSIEAALIHSGQSTVYALGHPPGKAGWRMGLRHPQQQSQTLGTLELSNQALSGSGQLLHGPHIIDPRTRRPADTLAGTWALAPTAAVADALSTAFMVLSQAEVQAVCERQTGVSAILCARTSAGSQVVCLPAGRDLLKPDNGPA